MSGAVKSGLIFALIGLIGVIAFTILPVLLGLIVGVFLCGPAVAVLNGGGAGYFGVRWSRGNAGVGQGVLAGAIAGVGSLIGAVILFVILLIIVRNIAQSDPQLYEQLLRNALQQQQGANLSPADLDTAMNLFIPIAGLCFGVLELLLSLAFGALGGWLATRNRAQPLAPPPMSPLT
jgi:hypothetical protein